MPAAVVAFVIGAVGFSLLLAVAWLLVVVIGYALLLPRRTRGWQHVVGAVVVLATMLAGRPLTGVLWNALHGGKNPWRQNRSALCAHYLASLAVLLVFAGRFVVKEWLYLADSTGWLAFAKIAMGTPLTALAALVVLWSFRRTTKVLKA